MIVVSHLPPIDGLSINVAIAVGVDIVLHRLPRPRRLRMNHRLGMKRIDAQRVFADPIDDRHRLMRRVHVGAMIVDIAEIDVPVWAGDIGVIDRVLKMSPVASGDGTVAAVAEPISAADGGVQRLANPRSAAAEAGGEIEAPVTGVYVVPSGEAERMRPGEIPRAASRCVVISRPVDNDSVVGIAADVARQVADVDCTIGVAVDIAESHGINRA